MKIYDYNGKKNICGDRIHEARCKHRLTQSELAAQLQIAGIILMIVSLWFIKGKAPTEKEKLTKTWTVLAILAFVFSGMAGVMEKIHQSTQGKDEKMTFVFIACLFMFVFNYF